MATFDSYDSPQSVEIDDEGNIDTTSVTDENSVPTTEDHYSYDILDAKTPFPIAEKLEIVCAFKGFNGSLLHKGSLETVTQDTLGFINWSKEPQIKRLGQQGLTKTIVVLVQAIERSDEAYKKEGKSPPRELQSSCLKKLRSMMTKCKSAAKCRLRRRERLSPLSEQAQRCTD